MTSALGGDPYRDDDFRVVVPPPAAPPVSTSSSPISAELLDLLEELENARADRPPPRPGRDPTIRADAVPAQPTVQRHPDAARPARPVPNRSEPRESPAPKDDDDTSEPSERDQIRRAREKVGDSITGLIGAVLWFIMIAVLIAMVGGRPKDIPVTVNDGPWCDPINVATVSAADLGSYDPEC